MILKGRQSLNNYTFSNFLLPTERSNECQSTDTVSADVVKCDSFMENHECEMRLISAHVLSSTVSGINKITPGVNSFQLI